MKFRHVRAVAACALVVVALTGARHSHGGGCGSSHSSSSSSSGGYSSSGSTTSSGSTAGSPTAGSTTPPESDIRITDCQVDSAAGTLSAKLSVTNHNSQGSAHYNGTVQFTDESGAVFGSAQISVAAVPAGSTRPVTVSDTFLKSPNGNDPKSGKCKLGQVWKDNS
ncbi:hypothetical protein OG863_10790 [Streptomyces decoyicus]|uniref:Lipoprotein n=1 Tax=Streptomyces decoyicus TaxID=249567 RepID=A0ABZ1FEC5_9ACTN|nr:hypothetical protein [Streptomyces decoyicus]WSB68403.1 hypothetical protein OG863_10790 [Streptomyces decoyicus]